MSNGHPPSFPNTNPMAFFVQLRAFLLSRDGQGYPAYKRLDRRYQFDRFELFIDHVQGDPFAEPSRLRVSLSSSAAGLPPEYLVSEARRRAVADFLNRAFLAALESRERVRGSGKSGELRVLRPGQEVLARTSVLVFPDGAVEARFRAGLPARGRTILGQEAARLLCEDIPAAVDAALLYSSLDPAALRIHLETVEDARALRDQLAERGLVAFVADGANLPRRSGVDDRPLAADRSVTFRSPKSLRVTLRVPNAGDVTGMGIPAGVTLLVGGGFHGKSTLLRAIERGVYDHVPGDGREKVVTIPSAVKVRAEDGRRVAGTDISNFINHLPGNEDTRHFYTENASGSTSQAASIAEALELGTGCLLLDEDTSATNLLIRDARVQALVAREHEPITPFIDRVRQLHQLHGVSTIMVVGGAGDYFDVADTVIAMREYYPYEVTAEAREVARRFPTQRRSEADPWRPLAERIPQPESIDPSRGRHDVKVQARGTERVRFGEEDIDLSAVEQLVETAQARAIAHALAWGRGRFLDGHRPLRDALEAMMEVIEEQGLDAIDDRRMGEYAAFRLYELGAALNRLRSLRVGRA